MKPGEHKAKLQGERTTGSCKITHALHVTCPLFCRTGNTCQTEHFWFIQHTLRITPLHIASPRVESMIAKRMLSPACSLLLLLALSPTLAFAQDDEGMSFDEEEAAEGYTFDEAEAKEGAAQAQRESADNDTVLAVVAVNSPALTSEQRNELQDAMRSALSLVSGYTIEGAGAVLGGLDAAADPLECSREAICLSNVGLEANVGRILVGRVTKTGETFKFDIDLFDTNEKLFLKFKTYENLSSVDDAIANVEPAVRSIFEIRTREGGREIETSNNRGIIQPIFAYTSAGLAALCIGGGIYFGLQAADERDAIIDSPKDPSGDYTTLTQRQARDQLTEAENTATTANVFYGLGAGLAIISAVLFVVDFGGDVASEEELNQRGSLSGFSIAPTVTTQGLGVGTGFRF